MATFIPIMLQQDQRNFMENGLPFANKQTKFRISFYRQIHQRWRMLISFLLFSIAASDG